MNAALWNRVQSAFYLSPTLDKALSEVNRILRKTYSDLPQDYIDPSVCTIRQEWFGVQQLRELKLRHTLSSPKYTEGPIVVVEYLGLRHVIDGTNRVNQWIAKDSTESHEVLLISRPE
jgi:hypothetical protein